MEALAAVNSMSSLTEEDWTRLTQSLEAFSEAWETSSYPPSIIDSIAVAEPKLARELIPELVKLDLEQRWHRGLRKLLEDYFDEIPELRSLISVDLIFEEFHIRRRSGDCVSTTEYFRRFPAHANDLDGLLRMDPALRSEFASGRTSATHAELSPGETIDDFDLLLQLGRGSFATVFLARQKSMQRLVALKVSADQGAEPQTLAQLDHDNIIRVYDQRLIPERSVRLLYMQYAAGGTLSDVIRRLSAIKPSAKSGSLYLKVIDDILDDRGESRPVDSTIRRQIGEMTWIQLVCWIGTQLAAALDYAHRSGILHRDIKPANVLLTTEGVPKLADFNISFDASLEGASAEAEFGGSLAYMSPEQLEACNPRHARCASDLDGKSDLYSLGIVLYELLTGKWPYDSVRDGTPRGSQLEHMTQLRLAGLPGDFQQSFVSTDDSGLGDALKRCLAPDGKDRYQSGIELATALDLCLQPDARHLLCDSTTRWKAFVRRWPQSSIILATLIPNLITAVFNFQYNRGEILSAMPDADAMFMRIQSVVNLIAFPTGILSAFWLIRRVAEATRVSDVRQLTSDSIEELRKRCLKLGNLAAAVGLTLWIIAAPVYPLALHLTRGNVPTTIYGHFLASLTLCGLTAAAYPFFAVSLIALRCLYPLLVQWSAISAAELPGLRKLSQSAWLHLFLAAAVPMLAVMILALTGLNRRFALVVLAVSGTLGFAVATAAFRLVQNDLQVLTRLIERTTTGRR